MNQPQPDRRPARLLQPLAASQTLSVPEPVGFSEAGIGLAIFWIEGKGAVEGRNGILDVFVFVIVQQISAAAQVLIVGGWIASAVSGQRYPLVALDGEAKHVKDAINHLVLDGEGVADVGVHGIGA